MVVLIPGLGIEANGNLGLDSLVFNQLSVSFQSLPSGHIQGTFELANKEENREKNRYPNILPSKTCCCLLLFSCDLRHACYTWHCFAACW